MTKKQRIMAFSLIELLIVITIISLLAMIAIPSYKNYVIKAKITEIFNLIDIHKLKLTEKIINNDTLNINSSINNPSNLVDQLEYINLNNNKYALKLTTNMSNLGVGAINNNNLIITITGEENQDNHVINWSCQYTAGFKNILPHTCTETI